MICFLDHYQQLIILRIKANYFLQDGGHTMRVVSACTRVCVCVCGSVAYRTHQRPQQRYLKMLFNRCVSKVQMIMECGAFNKLSVRFYVLYATEPLSLTPCGLRGCLDLDLDNSRQEPEAITATSGCALRKSRELTLERRYCVGHSD